LDGANLAGAMLSGACLFGVSLRGARLDGALLVGCDLSGADLSGASMRSANLTGARLSDADLTFSDLRGASLLTADLVGASAMGADMRDALFQSAVLDHTVLRSADLRWARLTGASLQGADVRDARFEGSVLAMCDFRDVRLSPTTDFGMAFLYGARFADTDLTRGHVRGIIGEEITDYVLARDAYRDLARVFSGIGRNADARWARRRAARMDSASHRPDRAPRYHPVPRSRAGTERLLYQACHTSRWLAGPAREIATYVACCVGGLAGVCRELLPSRQPTASGPGRPRPRVSREMQRSGAASRRTT
jgi:uncharacterized protein YjbI with pentapeptide repeats